MENYELQLKAIIGQQLRHKDCFVVHPSDDFAVYSLGTIIVVKSLLDLTSYFMKGHEGQICTLAISKTGKLLASGEQITDAGFQAALIVWDFKTKEMLYRVKFHKQRVQGLSFSCDENYLVSLGGKADGNLVIVWNMSEGKSEGLQVASNQPEQSCEDLTYFNNNPSRFITVHNNAIRLWSFDNNKKKFNVVDCQMGHIKRFIKCVRIDQSDTFAYCGTRTGDILEIYIDKANFKRVGPLNRIFTGGISSLIVSSSSELIIGAGDGSVAKINRKSMKIEDETKIPGGVSCLGQTNLSMFIVSSKGTVYNVRHSELLQKHEYFSSGHAGVVKQIVFPKGYSEVFATCSSGEIRVWSAKNQRELLRIELAKTGAQCNTIEFMSDGKLIVSGWSDGKVRAFLPQSGKLNFDSFDLLSMCHLGYSITEGHKEGVEVTALTTTADCQKILAGGSDGEIRLWFVGKQVQKLLMNQKLHTKSVTALQLFTNDQQVASSSLDGTIIIWSLTGQIPLQKVKVLTLQDSANSSSMPPVLGLAYNRMMNVLISCGGRDDRRIIFWDLASYKAYRIIQATYEGELRALGMKPDCSAVVVSDDSGEIKIFGFDDGKLQKLSNNGHAAPISAIQISPDSKKLVSGDAQGGVMLWDLE